MIICNNVSFNNFLYICPMIASRFIKKQKVTAFLLLVLLMGITGFKFLHTHDGKFVHLYGHQEHEIISNASAEKSIDCSICDYHLTGLVNPDFTFSGITHTDFEISFIHYSDAVFSSFLLNFSDRGPPSLQV